MVDIEFKKGFFSGQKHIKLLLVCTNEIAKTQKITLKKICQRSILCCSSFQLHGIIIIKEYIRRFDRG